MRLINKHIKIIKIVFIILVFIFVARLFITNINDLKAMEFEFNVRIFLLAIVFFSLYKMGLVYLWYKITVLYEANMSFKKTLVSWFFSLLGKYIPGKVFLLGGRLYYYDQEGISKKKITLCFIIENMCTFLGAALLFLVSITFIQDSIFHKYRIGVIALILLLLILINPKLMNGLINFGLKRFHYEPIPVDISYWQTLKMVSISVVNWVFLGAGFYLLANAIYTVPIKHFFYLTGSFALAVIIGLISFFSPSGIGVREGIMLLTLHTVMPEAAALVITVLSRVWTTISELILVAIFFIYSKVSKVQFNKQYTLENPRK